MIFGWTHTTPIVSTFNSWQKWDLSENLNSWQKWDLSENENKSHLALSIIEETWTNTNPSCGAPVTYIIYRISTATYTSYIKISKYHLQHQISASARTSCENIITNKSANSIGNCSAILSALCLQQYALLSWYRECLYFQLSTRRWPGIRYWKDVGKPPQCNIAILWADPTICDEWEPRLAPVLNIQDFSTRLRTCAELCKIAVSTEGEFWLGAIFISFLLETANSIENIAVCTVCRKNFLQVKNWDFQVGNLGSLTKVETRAGFWAKSC